MSIRAAVYSMIILTGSFCFGQMRPQPTMQNPQLETLPSDMALGTNLQSGANRIPGSLQGQVRSGDGRPVANARIEISDPGTGNSIASTYSDALGQFYFRDLQRGTYEVVASSGIFDAREEVNVMGPEMTVTLRMLNMGASRDGSGSLGDRNSVSVAALKVPEKAREELEKARQELTRSQFEESLKHVDKSLTIAPNFAEALTLRGILEKSSNHTEEAQRDLQQAINSDSSYGLAYVVMGATFNDQEKYADAIRTLERATQLAPTSWQAHFEMSRALLGTGDFQHALSEATRAEEIMPDFAPVHLVRAHSLMGCKEYSNAITEYQKYLSKDSTGPQADSAREGLDEARASAATGYVR